MTELKRTAGGSRTPQRLAELEDLELIRLLDHRSPEITSEAEQLLQERGFGSPQLAMARQLIDPDPRVRRRLAESLANLPTPPGPWLLWLSHDADPLVRTLVVSLMATCQDPRLQHRLRELDRLETDTAVREQLDQVFAVRRR